MKTLIHNLSDAFRVFDACFLASARCIFVHKNNLAPHSLCSFGGGKGLGTRLSSDTQNS
jgi:hypothetical protein